MVGCRAQVVFDKDTGKLQAVKIYGELNAGFDNDISGFCTWAFAHSIDQTYYAPHFDAHARYYRTNTLTRTAARAPGDVQSTYVMETIIEHVANACGECSLNHYALPAAPTPT